MAHDVETTSGATARQRRFPRLHWLTWLTLVASAIVVAVMEIPGFGVYPPTLLAPQPFMWGASAWGGGPLPDPDKATGPLQVEEFEHGWPYVYLRRAIGAGGKGWPKHIDNSAILSWPNERILARWNQRRLWSFSGDVVQWNAGALAVDLLIAVALIAIPTFACQRWIARRGYRLRLRIADLLALFVVVAAVLGWLQSHLQLQTVEQRLLEALPKPDANFQRTFGREHRREYRGPLWFDRLIGLSDYHWFHHLDQVTVIADEMTEEDWNLLSQAVYVRHLRLYGHVSEEAAAALRALPHLRALELYASRGTTEQTETPAMELQRLRRLRSLERLGCYRRDLLIEDMSPVAEMPAIREIAVNGISATLDEQHAFRNAHPGLVVKCTEPSRNGIGKKRVDPEEVALTRLLRWRKEDSVELGDPHDYDQSLDLRGIQLNTERLARLELALATAKNLSFDQSAAPATVIEILRKCPKLTHIEAAGLPANPALLARMAEMPLLEYLSISQGAASAADFRRLAPVSEYRELLLYETTLPEEALQDLRRAFSAHGSFDAYRGLDDETSAIPPELLNATEDPFSEGFEE